MDQQSLMVEGPLDFEEVDVSLDDIEDPVLPPSPAQAASFERFGVVDAVNLEYVPAREVYRITDGRRRVYWAKQVRDKCGDTIRARVFKDASGIAGPALTLSKNHARSANHASELQALEALMAIRSDATDLVLAQATGLAVGTVRARLRLRNLIPTLREAFDEGRIGVAAAEGASRLSKDKQKRLAATLKNNGKLTTTDVAHVRRVVAAAAVAGLPEELFQRDWATDVRRLLSDAAMVSRDKDLTERIEKLLADL